LAECASCPSVCLSRCARCSAPDDDKKRANNPPVGLVTPATDQDAGKKTYAYDPRWRAEPRKRSGWGTRRTRTRSLTRLGSPSTQLLFPRQVFFPMAGDKEGWQ